MCTTDAWRIAQKPLAVYAYSLKEKYNQTFGLTQSQFLEIYDSGEIQLSSVFENLFVITRNRAGLRTEKVSVDRYDFVRVDTLDRKTPLGDFKTTVLQKDGEKRRFVISSVQNKQGKIYAVCWNWITNQPNFFVIPPRNKPHPKRGCKILVHPESGQRTNGYYNEECAKNSWEDMCLA
jgi:hypothetical protein